MADPEIQPGFAPLSSDSDADCEPALEYAAPLAIRKRRANRGRRLSVTAKRPRSSRHALSISGVAARSGDGGSDPTAPTTNGVISSETEGLPPSAASHTSDVPHTTASGETGDNASPSSGQNSAAKFRAATGTTAATSLPADAQKRSADGRDVKTKQKSRGDEGWMQGIWQLLMARSRTIDLAPRPSDPRFVSLSRPVDQESSMKSSLAVTLFPDGYARHDSCPGRPLVKKAKVEPQMAENGTGVMKQPSFDDGESSLPIRAIAELPRFPYDRTSADFLQAIDLGLLPSEKDLPDVSHRHFYDGCLIAVVHDARRMSLPLPNSPKSVTPMAAPPSATARQNKDRVNGKVSGPPTPTGLGPVVSGGHGGQVASLSSIPSAQPASSASSLYQPGVVTARVRLRPDGYNKLEDIEKVTERLARDEARAVEEAIVRFTSAGVDCRPDAMKLKTPVSLNTLYKPRPLSASVTLRGHASHTPSLSTAALMLVSTADKQHQYSRLRHMNKSLSVSRGDTNMTSTGVQSATGDTAATKAASAKTKSGEQASGKVVPGDVAMASGEGAVGSHTLGTESGGMGDSKEVLSVSRSALPPDIIRKLPTPPATVPSAGKAERIRHMRLLQKGGQHARILQLQQLAQASGGMTPEATRQAQKALVGSNSGRPAYVLEVMKRHDRGYQVLIFRGLSGEKRELLRFSHSTGEEANAFVEQFRIVALSEGYECQQDARNPRILSSSNQQQPSGQQRLADPQSAIANRQHQAVLQAAHYQQQISQNQQQMNPQQLAQHQQLARQQFAHRQYTQQQLAAAQQQQRRRQEQHSPAQQGAQRPQQQQRQAMQSQQKSASGQPQPARQQQTPQQQQQLLNQQRQQQVQRIQSMTQHAPPHQQQFVAQLQQQVSPPQGSALHTSGGNRQGSSVPSPSFAGIVNGGVTNAVGISASLQSSQHLQQNHANRSVTASQDVMAFASQYPYQQKPPTISQQQHSMFLQQQIQMAAQSKAAQSKASLLRHSTNDQPAAATFTEDDLQPSKLPHQTNNRKV